MITSPITLGVILFIIGFSFCFAWFRPALKKADDLRWWLLVAAAAHVGIQGVVLVLSAVTE